MTLRSLEESEGSSKVHVQVELRVLDRSTDPCHRGKVDDRVESVLGKQPVDRVLVADVGSMEDELLRVGSGGANLI